MKRHALLTTALLSAATLAWGSGFQVGSQGVRQLGMGGTGTSVPWDASTIFYNPGGLARLEGMQAIASVQFLTVNTKWASTPVQSLEARTREEFFTPFNAYVGGTLRSLDRLGFGLGVYTPFGNGMSWSEDWPGRYLVQSVSMRTIFFQPTVSYRISEAVSVGAGLMYGIGQFNMSRALPLQDVNGMEGQAKIDANGNGTGMNFGVHVKASDALQFGLTYRTQVNMDFSGDAELNVPYALRPQFPSTGVSMDIPLPQVISLGVGFKPFETLTIQAEASLTGWKVFDSLGFRFDEQTDALRDAKSARHYQNTLAFRLGGLLQASENVQLMLGGYYDPTPVEDGFVSPDLPDSDRWAVSGGLTVRIGDSFTVLGAVEFGHSETRTAEFRPDNFNGKYGAKAFTANIGLSYDF